MLCAALPDKPFVQLQRMARIVPDNRLERYREDQEWDDVVDEIESLARRHQAGWLVNFEELEPWRADLLLFWLQTEQTFERQLRQIAGMIR